jgi:hypothetical protein
MKSKFGRINKKDLIKGAIVAGGTAILSGIASSLESGMTPNKGQIVISAKIGLFTAVSYLFKNAFTNSKDEFMKNES